MFPLPSPQLPAHQRTVSKMQQNAKRAGTELKFHPDQMANYTVDAAGRPNTTKEKGLRTKPRKKK
jgi:hypothetical protein